MIAKQVIKPVIFIVLISVVSALLAGLLVQELYLPKPVIVLPVFVAVIAFVLAVPFMRWFYRPFNELSQALKNHKMAELSVKGNEVVEQVCRSHNALLQDYAASANALIKSTNELSFTASHLSDVTESTNTNISKQQIETDMVATAMNEMSSTVEEVARNASEASAAAEKANEATTKGDSVAQVSKTSIEALVEDINKASNVIEQLEKQSSEITVVLEVIKGIAEQTNLLALNAAIEAARAGEQGRGFAVVADEVRSLATRTQTSAQEIDEMISRLQEGVHTSVSVMEIASANGQKSSERVGETLTVLTEIHSAVNIINDMNAQIATAAEEQSAVANEINENIVSITQIADATTHDAKDSMQTSVKIATISQELKELVGKLGGSDDHALDLSTAKAAHLNWKTRLRAFLDGEEALSREEAVSHKHCNFGKWYYSEGLEHFGHLQGIIDVEKPHEEIHELIRLVIDLKNNGQMAEAEDAYKQVAEISSTIVAHLDAAEQESAA